MSDKTLPLISTNDLAKRYGVGGDCIRRIVDRLELGQKVGRNRILSDSDLPAIDAAIKAGRHRERVRGEAWYDRGGKAADHARG